MADSRQFTASICGLALQSANVNDCDSLKEPATHDRFFYLHGQPLRYLKRLLSFTSLLLNVYVSVRGLQRNYPAAAKRDE
jgi:hypothetical protein